MKTPMLLVTCPKLRDPSSRAQLSHILARVETPGTSNVLVLDEYDLERADPTNKRSPIKMHPAASLMPQGIADHGALYALANETNRDIFIAIDVTGVPFESVESLIRTAGAVWVHLEHWHRGLILICNSIDALPAARVLADAFLVRSTPLTPYDRARKVLALRRRAFVLRLFGSGTFLRRAHRVYRVIVAGRRA